MLKPETALPSALTEQFGFLSDPSGNWLQNDFKRASIGGIEEGEWLPVQARVSLDGTRFEIGARKVDLIGLFELRRIANAHSQNPSLNPYENLAGPSNEVYQKMLDFWTSQPEPAKVRVTEEEDSVFMGMEVKPTARGLEAQISNIDFAFDAPVHAALQGMTYTQMVEDKRWWDLVMKQILESDPNQEGSTSGVFEYDRIEREVAEGATCETLPVVTAETLKDFPLETSRTHLNKLPGTLTTLDGTEKKLDDVYIIAHNGGNPIVDINSSESDHDWYTHIWHHDRTRLQLVIPEGVEVKTVADLAKLTRAQVQQNVDDEKIYFEMDVDIAVEDKTIKLVAKDPNNPFSLEIGTRACADCETPYWRYPKTVRDGVLDRDFSKNPSEWSDHAFLYGYGSGGGEGPTFTPAVGPNEGKEVCGDCIVPEIEAFVAENPLASRTKAIETARKNLDEIGHPEVQIWDDQVWRLSFGTDKHEGWEIFTYVDYERDGRKIRRHTGIPTLTDKGVFEPNLLPDEYIRFRHQVD